MNYKIFWCKVNKYYLEKWLEYFKNQNFDKDKDVIVSTCEVTDKAKSKWTKEVTNILNKWWRVYLTWCWTLEKWKLIDSKKFYSINTELKKFENKIFLLWEAPKWQKTPIKEQKISNSTFTKKFLVIQNWCDTNCTFCLTIKKRWWSSSRNEQEIIEEILDFEKWWWKEIVITWINLASWWCSNTKKPNESRFNDLLKSIIKKNVYS